jgi:methyl-accepting chemotaxis protein
MTGPSFDPKSSRDGVLEKARDLAEQVRQTAERVHQQALETHRLTEIARQQSERGRALSRSGRAEADAVQHSLGSSTDRAREAGRSLSARDED